MKISKNTLKSIIKECVMECAQELNEGMNNNFDYSHYAVNKTTKKIVNGWDYHDIDGEELRQFAKDYFTVDLIDNNFNPKDYVIWTKRTCLRNDIDPDDDSNWANS